jgi:xanthosine utilization system XapX-like protein
MKLYLISLAAGVLAAVVCVVLQIGSNSTPSLSLIGALGMPLAHRTDCAT